MSKPKWKVDEVRGDRYVRARATRDEIIVQVWNQTSPDGEPDGDWAMPKILGLELSIKQAALQTPKAKP